MHGENSRHGRFTEGRLFHGAISVFLSSAELELRIEIRVYAVLWNSLLFDILCVSVFSVVYFPITIT